MGKDWAKNVMTYSLPISAIDAMLSWINQRPEKALKHLKSSNTTS
jgi:hypothetical protein